MWTAMISRLRQPGRGFTLFSLGAAAALGVALGGGVAIIAPLLAGWTVNRLVFLALLAPALLGIVAAKEPRKVLLFYTLVAVSINLPFAPFGRAPQHSGGAQAGLVFYVQDFPLMALIALALWDTLVRRATLSFSRMDLAALLFIGWNMLSVVNAADLTLSFFEILRTVKLYVLFRIVLHNLRAREDVQLVFSAFLVGLVLQSVISVLQYTFNLDFGLEFITVGDLNRVTGTLRWPNTVGAFAGMMIILAVSLWIGGLSGRSRLLLGVAGMVGLYPLIWSLSRGAWVGFVMGVGVSLFLSWDAGWFRGRSVAAVLFFAALIVVAGLSFGSSIEARLRAETLSSRLDLNQVAGNMVQAHPVLGVGVNNFVEVMHQYDTTGVSYDFPEPVHNAFFLFAAEIGLVGLLLFVMLVGGFYWEGRRVVKGGDRFLSVSAIGVLSSMTVLLVSNLADVHLKTEALYTFFWVLLGLIVALRRLQAQSLSTERRSETQTQAQMAGGY